MASFKLAFMISYNTAAVWCVVYGCLRHYLEINKHVIQCDFWTTKNCVLVSIISIKKAHKNNMKSRVECEAKCCIAHTSWVRDEHEMRWGDGIAFINHHESSTFIHSVSSPPSSALSTPEKKSRLSFIFSRFFGIHSVAAPRTMMWRNRFAAERTKRYRNSSDVVFATKARLFNKINLL